MTSPSLVVREAVSAPPELAGLAEPAEGAGLAACTEEALAAGAHAAGCGCPAQDGGRRRV